MKKVFSLSVFLLAGILLLSLQVETISIIYLSIIDIYYMIYNIIFHSHFLTKTKSVFPSCDWS